MRSSQDLENKNEYLRNEIYQRGTSAEENEDFVLYSNSTSIYKISKTINDLNITIPIGIEFRLPKNDLSDHDAFSLRNFCFRIGTCYNHRFYNTDSREKFVNSTNYERINYGDGIMTVGTPDQINLTVRKINNDLSESTKRFTAGIGYQHSENLSIDLGGYMDSNKDNYYIGAMFTLKK